MTREREMDPQERKWKVANLFVMAFYVSTPVADTVLDILPWVPQYILMAFRIFSLFFFIIAQIGFCFFTNIPKDKWIGTNMHLGTFISQICLCRTLISHDSRSSGNQFSWLLTLNVWWFISKLYCICPHWWIWTLDCFFVRSNNKVKKKKKKTPIMNSDSVSLGQYLECASIKYSNFQ